VCCIPLEGEKALIVTGSEDWTIKVFAYSPESELSLLGTVNGLPGMVRALAVSTCTEGPRLLFAAGGKELLHAYAISLDAGGGLSMEALAQVGEGTVRKTGKWWLRKKELEERRAEHMDVRHMSLVAFPLLGGSHSDGDGDSHGDGDVHVVATGNSQGVLRVYVFTRSSNTFRKVVETEHHGCPILSLAFVAPTQEAPHAPMLLFSGASTLTDTQTHNTHNMRTCTHTHTYTHTIPYTYEHAYTRMHTC
jgi:hypothetical protein